MKKEGRSLVKFSLLGAVLAMGCNGSGLATEAETFEVQGNQIEFRGKSSDSALSKEEWKTYLADRKYLRSIVRGDDAVGVNHADPRQHSFALLRLKLAGKTRQNSPQLFKQIEQLKAQHQVRGLSIGTVENVTPQDSSVASQHYTLSAGGSATENLVVSGAMASRMDLLSYNYFDSAMFDKDGNPIGLGRIRRNLWKSAILDCSL